MCYQTVHIRNNSLHFDVSKDKMFLNVPCGTCGECRTKKFNDTTARLYYEYIKTINTKVPGFFYKNELDHVDIRERGYVFLQTLTYNEEMCPWLHGIKCFRPDDYRSFMRNLRDDWYKEFPPGTLKVHWVSEYGGETYRPHYHQLFFITAPCTPEHFEELCRHNWCIITSRNGAHAKDTERIRLGWTDIENPYSHKHTRPSQLVADSIRVMGYCAGYVGKDIDFEEVLEKQKNSKFDGLPITKDDFRFLKPFTRQSNGVGECIKDMVSIEELMDGRMTIPDTLLGEKVISLPLYIDRKLFYDYDPSDKCFKLNEKGYEMKEHRRDHNRGYIKKQITYLIDNISTFWNDKTAYHIKGCSIRDHTYIKFGQLSPEICFGIISDTLQGDRFNDFIDYIMYYKDISSTYAMYVDDGVDLKRFAESIIVKKYGCPPLQDDSLISWQYYRPQDYRAFLRSRYGQCCDRFKGFDQVLSILNGVNLSFCAKQQDAYLARQKEKSRQKKVYSRLMYKSFHSLNR